MDAYNIIIIGLINILILIILEGIVVQSLLITALNSVINNILNLVASKINDNLNNNYPILINSIQQSINNFANVNPQTESFNFISLAFRLYGIGYFSDELINEYKLILNNMIKSTAGFAVIVFGIIITMIIVYVINIIVFDGIYSLNMRLLVMNLIIGLILIIVFLVAVGLGVFAKINPDTTDIQVKILTYITDNLNRYIK